MSTVMIFTTVMTTGLGCGIGCGSLSTPLVVSKMLGEARSKKGCMIATGIFSVGKILMYMLLGILASIFGNVIINQIQECLPNVTQSIFRVVSLCFGIVMIKNALKKQSCRSCKQCGKQHACFNKLKDSSYFMIGLVYAVIPCSPLIIALTYSAGMNPALAALLMFCFGVVNSVFSVMIYAPIVGVIIERMQTEIPQYYKWIQVLAALMLIGMAFLIG